MVSTNFTREVSSSLKHCYGICASMAKIVKTPMSSKKCFETGFHSGLFLVFLLGKLEFEHSCITGKNSAAAVTVLLRERLLLRLFSDILSICNEVEGAFFTPPRATIEATKTRQNHFSNLFSSLSLRKNGDLNKQFN